MPDKLQALVEAFPAIGAFVGLLSRVNPLMPDEVRGLVKTLPAIRAAVRLLARVSPPVTFQVRVVAETLPTDVTNLPAFRLPGSRRLWGRSEPGSLSSRSVLPAVSRFSFRVNLWALICKGSH